MPSGHFSSVTFLVILCLLCHSVEGNELLPHSVLEICWSGLIAILVLPTVSSLCHLLLCHGEPLHGNVDSGLAPILTLASGIHSMSLDTVGWLQVWLLLCLTNLMVGIQRTAFVQRFYPKSFTMCLLGSDVTGNESYFGFNVLPEDTWLMDRRTRGSNHQPCH